DSCKRKRKSEKRRPVQQRLHLELASPHRAENVHAPQLKLRIEQVAGPRCLVMKHRHKAPATTSASIPRRASGLDVVTTSGLFVAAKAPQFIEMPLLTRGNFPQHLSRVWIIFRLAGQLLTRANDRILVLHKLVEQEVHSHVV